MTVYQGPSGPSWVKNPTKGHTTQVDGKGVSWTVVGISKGGRELRWCSGEHPSRTATTVCTEGHPGYPSDAEVVAWERAQRKDTPPMSIFNWFPVP